MRLNMIILALAAIMMVALVGCEELPITGDAVKDSGSDGQNNGGGFGDQYQGTAIGIAAECSDGIDNDEDNFIDMKDSDCDSEEDDSEKGTFEDSTADEGDGTDNEDTEENTESSYCGDDVCSDGERCDKCEDCGCDGSAVCHDGVCKIPACRSDADCEDGDSCNIDKCYFPGHPNAYCTDIVITRLTGRDDDRCCPPGENAMTDLDCPPVCGNGVCEPGENERLCLEDCEFTGEGGSGSSGGSPSQGGGETGPEYG
ncbi:MAG: hypothetical protein KJ574_00640 [Nanoarchaeota archaeon]|nr:hypothetical protein [Nanoarchaeota archaeon]